MTAVDKHETIGDAPIDPEFRQLMNGLAAGIDEIFNGDATGADRKTGFVLLVFPFADAAGKKYQGRANYISNANRADIVVLLKEQLARFEGRMGEEGTA